MKFIFNSHSVLLLLALLNFLVISCNGGGGNEALQTQTYGLIIKHNGDSQEILPGKAPAFPVFIRVVDELNRPAKDLEFEVFSDSQNPAKVLDKVVRTDSNGVAYLSFTAPPALGVPFNIVAQAISANIVYRFNFKTPTTSPSTRFDLSTSSGSSVVAGEKISFIIKLVNEDKSIFKFNGDISLQWQYTTTASWHGISPLLPSEYYTCKFVDGVCETSKDYYLTDVRNAQKISVGDGSTQSGVSNSDNSNFIDAFAIEIQVLENEPAKLTVADRLGGPDEGAVSYDVKNPIKMRSDFESKLFYPVIIDKAGNFLGDANSDQVSWFSPNPLLNSSMSVTQDGSLLFNPDKTTAGEILLTDVNGVLDNGDFSVVVRPGAPVSFRVITQNPNNSFEAGSEVQLGLEILDEKGNICDQISDNIVLDIASAGKLTDRFGPSTGGGAKGTLYGADIVFPSCGIIGDGWCGQSSLLTTTFTYGTLGRENLSLRFFDKRFPPRLNFETTQTTFRVQNDPDLYQNGEISVPEGKKLSGNVLLNIFSDELPTHYVLHSPLPSGFSEKSWYKTIFPVSNSIELFRKFENNLVAVSVDATIDSFKLFVFMADKTGNIIWGSCPEETVKNPMESSLFACAGKQLTLEANGSIVNGHTLKDNYIEINPKTSQMGPGYVKITDPSYPDKNTFFNVKVQAGLLHSIFIYAQNEGGGERNKIDATRPYEIVIEARDQANNLIPTYSGNLPGVQLSFDASELTSSPKGTQPLLPTTAKQDLQFSAGRIILNNLRIPKSGQKIRYLKATSGQFTSNEVTIESIAGEVKNLKLLSQSPFLPAYDPNTVIDYSKEVISRTADESINIYAVAFDNEENPTLKNFYESNIQSSGDLFHWSYEKGWYNETFQNGNKFTVNLYRVRAAPYTAEIKYLSDGEVIASAVVNGVLVTPGAPYGSRVYSYLPEFDPNYVQGTSSNYDSRYYAKAGESRASNGYPAAKVCVVDRDANVVTSLNQDLMTTLIWQNNNTGSILSLNRFTNFPSNGIKKYYQGCVLEDPSRSATDNLLNFTIKEAGILTLTSIISDYSSFSRLFRVVPGSPHSLRASLIGDSDSVIVGKTSNVVINVVDQFSNPVAFTKPINIQVTSSQASQDLVGSTLINPSVPLGMGEPISRSVSGGIPSGSAQLSLYSTHSGGFNLNLSGEGLVSINTSFNFNPDTPVALRWSPSLQPKDEYIVAANPWSSFSAELIDQFNNIASNASGSVKLTLDSGTSTLFGQKEIFLNSGKALFYDINYKKVETIKIKATHASSGLSVDKSINVVQGNPDRIILIGKNQVFNENANSFSEAVSGNIESPFSVNDDSLNTRYAFEAYVVDPAINIVKGYSGKIRVNPTDLNAQIYNSSNVLINSNTDIDFVDGKAVFYVRFRTVGINQKINLDCRGIISTQNCQPSDVFAINPGEPKYLVPLLAGQSLNNPGKDVYTQAVSANPESQSASVPHIVRVIATDRYFNKIPDYSMSGLQLSFFSNNNSDTLISDGGPFNIVNGEGSVSVINYQASSGKTLKVQNPPSGMVSITSKAYSVLPGPATRVIAILPGQTYNPGVDNYALAVIGNPSPLTACQNVNLVFRAVDSRYNTVTSESSSISFTTSDPKDVESGYSGSFISGVANFNIKAVRTGADYTISPAHLSLTIEPPSSYSVNTGSATQLISLLNGQIYNPGVLTRSEAITGVMLVPPVAGVPHDLRVYAVDACFNQVTTATNPVSISTTDPNDIHPAVNSLVGGYATFSIINTTSGNNQTVTASASGLLSGVSESFAVLPNDAAKIIAVAPNQVHIPGKSNENDAISGTISNRTVNADYTATVYLTDNWHNRITDSSFNSISISAISSDANDTHPDAVLLNNGTAVLTFNHKTSGGGQTLTFTSTGSVSDSYTSKPFTVNPASAIKAIALLPGQNLVSGKLSEAEAITGEFTNPLSTAGASFPVTVYAVDSYHNIVTSENRSVGLLTSDPNDSNPSTVTFSSGQRTFSVTNTTRGIHTVTPVTNLATNRVSDSFQIATGSATQAIALLPNQILIEGKSSLNEARTTNGPNPFSKNAGEQFEVKVYITDSYFNIIQDDNRSVTILPKNDPFAQVIGDSTKTVFNGVGEFIFQVKNFKASNNLFIEISETNPYLATKHVTSNYTISPGAGTQVIGYLPGQTFNPGASSLSQAIVGVPSPSMACNDTYQVQLRVVDEYFNVVSNSSSFSLTTTEAGNPKTNFTNRNFTAGIFSAPIYPTKFGSHTLGVSLPSGSSLSFPQNGLQYTVDLNSLAYLIATLDGESLVEGARSLEKTGSIVSPVVGIPSLVTLTATDQCFNKVNSTLPVSIQTADPYDVNLSPKNLENGSTSFSVTHQTASSSLPQGGVTQHKITPSFTNGTVGADSSIYTVSVGNPHKVLVLLPGENYLYPGKSSVDRMQVITGTPATQTKGIAFTPKIILTDMFFNKVTGNSSTISLSSNDNLAVLPESVTLENGEKSFNVTHQQVLLNNSAKLTATYSADNFDSSDYSVKDVPPTNLAYSPSDFILTMGNSYTFTPSNAGGAITSYTYSGTFPSGITIDEMTGIISGTPDSLTTLSPVVVTGHNSSGIPVSTTLNFKVNDVPPANLTYTGGPNFNWEQNETVVNSTPLSEGGPIVSYSLSSGALPSGVSLNLLNGHLTGTPTTNGTYSFTIKAINTGGETSISMTAIVGVERPRGFEYAGNPFSLIVNTNALNILPSNLTGGAPSSYTLQVGSLPTNLSLDNATGKISGTPSSLGTYNFTVRASNNSGHIDQTVTITINDMAPAGLAYSGGLTQTWIKNTGINITPSVNPSPFGGTPTSYEITATGISRLPAGVSFDETTGIISGAPVEIGVFTPTVTARNITGFDSKVLNLTVNDIQPSNLSYSDENAIYQLGTVINNNLPTSSGGAVVSYTVTPNLPHGLSLDSTTGVISGTPRIAIPQTSFTITATNSGGSTSKIITIKVELPQLNQLAGWWRAEDNSAVGQNNPIVTWSDLSSHSHDFSGTESTSPVYQLINNNHQIVFNNQSLGQSDNILNGEGNLTIVIAFKSAAFNPNNTLLSLGRDLNENDNIARSLSFTTNGSVITSDETVNLLDPLTTDGVLSVVFESGSGQYLSDMKIYHQGISKNHTGTNTVALNLGNDGGTDYSSFGARLNISGEEVDKLNGSILEVIIFDSNLSEIERKNVECHLNAKYDLNISICP